LRRSTAFALRSAPIVLLQSVRARTVAGVASARQRRFPHGLPIGLGSAAPCVTSGAAKLAAEFGVNGAGEGSAFREFLRVHGLILLLIAVGFYVAAQYLAPLPPRSLALATGVPGGVYQAVGERYRAILAEKATVIDLISTEGMAANLVLLADPALPVDAALIQGGVGRAEALPLFETLAACSLNRSGFSRARPAGPDVWRSSRTSILRSAKPEAERRSWQSSFCWRAASNRGRRIRSRSAAKKRPPRS
jgi:hypothetical protein